MERATAAERAEIAKSARAYFDFAQRAIAPPRRNSSPSAAFPAPANRGWRAIWRRTSHRCPAPSSCAPTSSARRCSASARPTSCRDAYTPAVTERVYAVADKARRILAAGHSAIVDAVFAQPQERDAFAEAAKAADVPAARAVPHRGSGDPARPGRRPRRDASDADQIVARAQESYDLGPLDWPGSMRPGRPRTLGAGQSACRRMGDATAGLTRPCRSRHKGAELLVPGGAANRPCNARP